ncbi:MAG TPA: SWIM zinc finger family protein [Ktedonobacterales bacterium]
MELTVEQVLALAPDAAAAKAGKQQAVPKPCQGLGRSAEALWGQCQGSALYQVKIELVTLTCACTCPSHKLPCKHSLGLLLLLAGTPAALPEAEPPEWVHAWLSKRAAAAGQRQTRAVEQAEKAAHADPVEQAKQQAKRADKRMAQVQAGIASCDLWLNDLVRNGLAGLEQQPASFWENQAARLVDAQAPGVAQRVRKLAELPGSGPDWPERLLGELGRLALLTHAFARLEALDPALREDVRQLIGWTLTQDEVAARGEHLADGWLLVGQWVEEEDRFRTQRNWLVGARSGRHALILQYSPRPILPPFPEPLLPATQQAGELAYWPSAYPLRARFVARQGMPDRLTRLPGVATFADALAGVAGAVARQPWLDRFLIVVNGATILRANATHWRAQDRAGSGLPLTGDNHWRLLALGGGAPVDLAGEWDGLALRPLAVGVEGAVHPL